jgi:FHS family L-fucose permease-like MFS transporter
MFVKLGRQCLLYTVHDSPLSFEIRRIISVGDQIDTRDARLPAPSAEIAETSETSVKSALFAKGNTIPFILVTALFFLWAIPNHLNDVLIKQFMKSFDLSRLEAGAIQSAFYLAYFVVPIPAALMMRRFGFKRGLMIGLLLFLCGTLLFCSAALIGRYEVFLIAQFVIASGVSVLETGANTFIVLLGHPSTAERRLNFSQAFNPLGAVVGVLIGTMFVFSGVELSRQQVLTMKAEGSYSVYLNSETHRVIAPYLLLSILISLWGVLSLKTKFPEPPDQSSTSGEQFYKGAAELFDHPNFVRGVIAQFMYVMAQIGTWSYFIPYVQDYVHLPERRAGMLLTGTLLLFTLGRFISSLLMRFVNAKQVLGIYSMVCACLITFGILFPGWAGVISLFMTSFFKAPMFPTIFALGVRKLGRNTKLGGSIMVMAIAGGACAPIAMGLIYKFTHNMASAFIVPLISYSYIPYYAWRGSQDNSWSGRDSPEPASQESSG